MRYDVKVGYPDREGRSAVQHRHGKSGYLIGYVREMTVSPSGSHGRRWFAETAERMPIEGTHRTKSAAVDALLEHDALRGSRG